MTGGQFTFCILAACGSVYGMQAVNQQAEIGWKDLIGGGAVGAVLFTVMVFLRNISEIRREHGEMVKDIGGKFASAVTEATKVFAESTHRTIESGRQHNERNIEMMQQIINDMRNDNR